MEGDDERKKKKKKDSDGMDDDQIPPSALRTLLLPPLHSETMIIPDYASLIAGTLCCCSCFSFFFFSPPNLSYQVLLFYCDSRIAKCFSFLPVKRNRIIFLKEEEKGEEISFDGPWIRFGLGNIRGRQRC